MCAHHCKLFNVAKPKESTMYYICKGINEARKGRELEPVELTVWAHKEDKKSRIEGALPKCKHVEVYVM